MSRYNEDEYDTTPGHRSTHSDLHYHVGILMAENINFRKRIEVLEALALRTEGHSSDRPTTRAIIPLVKKTVTYAVLIFAGIFEALKESGLLGHIK